MQCQAAFQIYGRVNCKSIRQDCLLCCMRIPCWAMRGQSDCEESACVFAPLEILLLPGAAGDRRGPAQVGQQGVSMQQF